MECRVDPHEQMDMIGFSPYPPCLSVMRENALICRDPNPEFFLRRAAGKAFWRCCQQRVGRKCPTIKIAPLRARPGEAVSQILGRDNPPVASEMRQCF